MLGIAILLIIVGIFAAIFGVVQNTILFNIFADLNARLERANLESDFEFGWIWIGPGTVTLVIGLLVAIAGVALIFFRRMKNRRLRQINENIKHTNKKRKKQGKRARKR